MFFVRISRFLTLICVCFTLYIPNLYSLEPYTVRTVYFMPTDSIDRSAWLDLDNIMKNNQEVYESEMERHGFPGKTFRLETDNQGQVIVHKIKGMHNKAHYSGDTYALVKQELQVRFNDKKNIYAIVVGGMPVLQWGQAGGVAGASPGGWWNKGEDHAFIVSGETTLANTEQVILHELGHAFGLWHIALYDPQEFILGSGKKLSLHEARWLSKSYYFNDVWIFGFAPSIVKFHGAEAFGDDIRFRVDVTDPNGLHQAYAWLNTNIVGWDFLHGNDDTATFDVERRFVENDTELWIQLMDSHGNWLWYRINYVLPEQSISANDGTQKYLTIRDRRIHSLVPINNEKEWCGWENAGIFEKPPNKPRPELPRWYLNFPELDEWDSWFYSHAKSRFVYDISNSHYNTFQAILYMPNDCNEADKADIEIILYADNNEFFHSGVLRPADAKNKKITAQFPKDTNILTIEVTDAKDGINCDHFVLGNARVFVSEPDDIDDDVVENEVEDNEVCVNCMENIDKDTIEEDLSVSFQNKLTTRWATIKERR